MEQTQGSAPFLQSRKISICLDVSEDKRHNEIHTHNFFAGCPYSISNAGGPVFWGAKWDAPGIGNCDLHECVRILFLG